MPPSIGIVGLPNVGKSTLFNALTGNAVTAANYPFATIDPNVGVVGVPDQRLEALAEMAGSERTTEATITFVDIAGLVRGASEGEGLGNRFLANIREVDAICHVVRVFEERGVSHVEESPDPLRDIATVNTELAIADLEAIDRRLPRLQNEATADRALGPTLAAVRKARQVIAAGGEPSRAGLGGLDDLFLLTAKPVIYLFNVDQAGLGDKALRSRLAESVAPARAVFADAQVEAELTALDPEDRTEMRQELGQSGLRELVGAAFETLGLQTFLTANPRESRAWAIRVGATAFEAAGVVHSDFQRGFIAAEVITFSELAAAGSWQEARASGLVRTEGRGYEMGSDDVVEFRFNA